jgi:predicted nuclease with TOPRIM domain
LLNIEGLALDDLDKTIKDIITNLEYSPENYIKLLEENRSLKQTLEKANQINNTEKIYILQTENTRLKLENLKLIKRYKSLSRKTNETVNETDILVETDIHPITQDDVNSYGNVLSSLKKITKNKDGMYDVGGKQYEILYGTRQEVWNEKAYKTSGGLLKNNIIINKEGLFVSKRKSILETKTKRLFVCGVNKTPDEPI